MAPEVGHTASNWQRYTWESWGLVPNPTLSLAQGRGSQGLHNVTPSQGCPEFSATASPPLQAAHSCPRSRTAEHPSWKGNGPQTLEGKEALLCLTVLAASSKGSSKCTA